MNRSSGSLAHVAPLPRQARIAGLCYLLVIAGGIFAEVVVRGSLIVPGDAAATARAIAENEALWRWGLADHLLYLVPAVMVNVLIYGLLEPVHATLARLALFFGVASVTIEAVALLNLAVPLALIDEGTALAALDEAQRQALMYLGARLFSTGFGFALVFFAATCALIGVLILRSRPIPRAIGALMITAAACYVVASLTAILSPSLSNALIPWILLPIIVAELSLAIWLTAKAGTLRADVTSASAASAASTGQPAS